MSLAVLADHLASKGRNGDSMLVHMSPEEVHGLHALALAHGEQMTINPETGLPEAFSLKSLLKSVLPIAAGIALGPAGFGLVSSGLAAGAIVGGATALATGSLQQGLMAGVGAYGGFGLGEGLMGAAAASPEAAAQALGTTASTAPGSQAAMLAAQNAGFGAEGLNQLAGSAAYAQGAAPVVAPSFMSGIQALGNEQGRDAFMQSIGGGKGLMRAGYAALMPAMNEMAASQRTVPNLPNAGFAYTPRIRPMAFDPYTGSLQQLPMFNAIGAASGGLVALADGGSTNSPGLTMADVRRLYQEKGGSLPTPASEQPAFGAQMTPTNQKIYDYLMGRGPYPVNPTLPEGTPLFKPYLESIGMKKPAAPVTPAATDTTQKTDTTQMIDTTQTPSAVRGGGGGDGVGGGAAMMGLGALGLGALGLGSRGSVGAQDADTSGSLSGGLIPYLVDRPAGEPNAPIVDMNPPMGGYGVNNFDFAGGYWGDPGYSDLFNSGGVTALAHGGDAHYNLGGYSDGGRLLRGPGDGVSDDIPATIGDRQPARLADGEFVVPARIVSELGNGSTEAGARQLYAMMDRVQRARSRTMGEDRVAADTNAAKFLPA